LPCVSLCNYYINSIYTEYFKSIASIPSLVTGNKSFSYLPTNEQEERNDHELDEVPVVRFRTFSKAIASLDNVKAFQDRVAFASICCIRQAWLCFWLYQNRRPIVGLLESKLCLKICSCISSL